MKRPTSKKHYEDLEGLTHFADPIQLRWFSELRDALSPYWSARAEHSHKKHVAEEVKVEHSDAA